MNPTIRRAVRLSLAAGASSLVLPTTVAFAQEQSDNTLAEVVVTGSRIQRQDYQAPSPVVTISTDVLRGSGEPQLETILNSLPQLVPSITTTSNNPSNGGQANVDLRGLGTTRTLVLLDGTRVVPSNVTGVVDLNTFPAALIDNIEILSGGASSVYGSDAIAGVVNVRLKRNFSGLQLNAQTGQTGEDDGRTTLFEALLGGNFNEDRGNAVISLAYDKRDEVFAGARPFGVVSRGPTLQPLGSSTTPSGGISFPAANRPTAAAVNTVFSGYGVAAGVAAPNITMGFNADGSLFSYGNGSTNAVANFRGDTTDPGFNPLSYSYNFGPANYLQLPIVRRQIAGFARYDMIPEKVEAYARINYTTYSADQELAATPITCAGTALGCSVPANNTALPAALRTLLASRALPNDPFPMTRRIIEAGSRQQENKYNVVQGLFGLRGEVGSYNWDVYASWGEGEGTSLQGGNISRARYQAGLNNAAVYAAQGCATFNPFGTGTLTPACAAAVSIQATNVLSTEQTNMVGSFSGPLFKLPAGELQFAVGAEYRESSAKFRPDSFLSSGDVVGFNAQQPVNGTIISKELFTELSVPLLSGKKGAQYLGLDFGYRYSDYNLSGGVNTYKAGVEWNPVESFKVRGTYNRAVRAPNINDLFLPRQENFPQYSDPCNANSSFRTGSNAAQVAALCQAQGIPAADLATFTQSNPQARAFVGGNLNLTPETADTYTFGVVWQSASESVWREDLNVTLDYFDYKIDDIIGSITASSIIGRCFNQLNGNPTFSATNQFCQLFTRNPNQGNSVTDIQTTQLNLSSFKLKGVDLQVDYTLPLSAFGASDEAGKLTFNVLFTKLLSVEQQTAADPFIAREGTIGQTVGSAFPSWKGRVGTTYNVKNLKFGYTLRYIDGMDVVNNNATLSRPTIGVVPYTPTYLYHDISAKWSPNDTYSINLGVNNLFDKAPPIYTTDAQAGVQSNTDPSTYEVLGRRYFLNISAKF
jgi:iron complex outermembrane receptor protein